MARAEALRKKEEELARREATLDQRTQILIDREKMEADPRPPNWPRCRPILHHDIMEDIKGEELRKLCKFGYAGWIGIAS